MATKTPAAPNFWNFLLTSLLTDISADVMPDAQAVLALVESGGYQALLQPANQLTVASFLVKIQADGLATGNDLSKQVATFLSQWLTAKLATLVTATATPATPAA